MCLSCIHVFFYVYYFQNIKHKAIDNYADKKTREVAWEHEVRALPHNFEFLMHSFPKVFLY